MSVHQIEQYISSNLPNVTRMEHGGYIFYFYASEQALPVATIALSDNEYDNISGLSREGVYRVNIGIRKDTFTALFPDPDEEKDYTALNRFLPHPHYAPQYYICILNPEGQQMTDTLQYIEEAYSIAKQRFERKQAKHKDN